MHLVATDEHGIVSVGNRAKGCYVSAFERSGASLDN
jgi:hypothetical protein